MLYFNTGFNCVCNDSNADMYLTFSSKSKAKDWLFKHDFYEYKDFPGVWFEGAYPYAEYRIRKFLGLSYYGIVREIRNKREFLRGSGC